MHANCVCPSYLPLRAWIREFCCLYDSASTVHTVHSHLWCAPSVCAHDVWFQMACALNAIVCMTVRTYWFAILCMPLRVDGSQPLVGFQPRVYLCVQAFCNETNQLFVCAIVCAHYYVWKSVIGTECLSVLSCAPLQLCASPLHSAWVCAFRSMCMHPCYFAQGHFIIYGHALLLMQLLSRANSGEIIPVPVSI